MLAAILIPLAGLCIFLVIRSKKGSGTSWVKFYAQGKDSGFSFKEIELLRRLAIQADLEDPTALFWSQNQLDLCIRSMVRQVRLSGSGGNQTANDFLSKLYDFRKKIELEKPRRTTGITGTREISELQKLRILAPGGKGVLRSQVIKNYRDYLLILRPFGVVPSGFSWNGQGISIYFWRKEDAAYGFDSNVLDEVLSNGIATLKISHSTSLERSQKRKSIRLKLHKAAFFYLLPEDESPDMLEVNPGLKCFLEDLSDSGCAVIIGGKAVVGLRVKVQFNLNNTPISMGGSVCSVEYHEKENRSLLHIKADTLPLETRNHILGEVFGMLPDEDDFVSFHGGGPPAALPSSEEASPGEDLNEEIPEL